MAAGAAAQVQPARAGAFQVVVGAVAVRVEEELHAGVFPGVLAVRGAHGAHRIFLHAEVQLQRIAAVADVEGRLGPVREGVRPVQAGYSSASGFAGDFEHIRIEISYKRYNGAETISIDNGSAGVTRAARTNTATMA